MKYVNCIICHSDNWFVRYPSTLNGTRSPQVEAFRCTNSGYGEHTQIVECFECGHVYANPTWESAELLTAYETVEDETYVDEREGRELTFQKHLEEVEKLTGPANGRTLLDVGAYIGVFVEIAQRSGWDAMGVEPSTWGVGEAKKRNLNVIEGTLAAPELVGKQFDVITLWDVIEHVQEPRAELEAAFKLLKPGGLVVVHTMDVESLTARVMRHRWPWYMAMHVHYFGKTTLSRLVSEVGFDVELVQTEGRYLRMGYLASRVGGISAGFGRIADTAIRRANLAEKPVPVNFGDLFTVYAKKSN